MTARNFCLLDIYTDYLLVSFGQASATGLSRLLPDISHDQVTRFLAQETLTDKDLWHIVKPHLRKVQSDEAVLIIDDTVEEKPYTDESELITWHFDHTVNRHVKGINLVSCLYHNQQASLPVGFHLVHKTELTTFEKTNKKGEVVICERWQSPVTKNEIARTMVSSAIAKQIPFRYVRSKQVLTALTDAWFSCAENMTFIKQTAKKDFIMPLKSNRKVAFSPQPKKKGKWQSLDSLDFDTNSLPTLYLEGIPFPLQVMRQGREIASSDFLDFINENGSQGILYLCTQDKMLCILLCSDLSLSKDELATIYQKRWNQVQTSLHRVEEYHKSLKSNAALSKSPTKLPRTQSNHFFASLVAFVKMETMRFTTKWNHFALKTKLYQAALVAAFNKLTEIKQENSILPITL